MKRKAEVIGSLSGILSGAVAGADPILGLQ